MYTNQIAGLAVAAYAASVAYGMYQNYKFEKEQAEFYQMMDETEADLRDRLQGLGEHLRNPRAYAAQYNDLKVEVIDITRKP